MASSSEEVGPSTVPWRNYFGAWQGTHRAACFEGVDMAGVLSLEADRLASQGQQLVSVQCIHVLSVREQLRHTFY